MADSPEFLRLDCDELHRLFHVERDALATHVYILLLMQAGASGEVCTTYSQLIEACTPPRPERGRPRPGPTVNVVRRVVEQLERAGLVTRDARRNEAQQQLRLLVHPRT